MKITQISTSSSGGAGISALRLNNLLVENGIESHLVTRKGSLNLNGKPEFRKTFKRLESRSLTLLQTMLTKKPYGILTPISKSNLTIKSIIGSSDLLHIHNWYNLMSLQDMVEINREMPLVFTLHDERLFTGGCHMTLGCTNFENICQNCPGTNFGRMLVQKTMVESKLKFEYFKNFSVIAPSDWILSQFKKSTLSKKAHEIVKIPNVIDTQKNSRKVNYTKNRVFRLLFISAQIEAEVKGLQILLKSIEELNQTDFSVSLDIVGAGEIDARFSKFSNIRRIGIMSPSEIGKFLGEFDLLVVPSLSENSPNVIAEAQLAGLPVLGTNVGGIPELITNRKTGFICEPNPSDITRSIKEAIVSNELSTIATRAFHDANKRYSNALIIEKTTDVYRGLLHE